MSDPLAAARLAVVITHPIQYYSPLFRLLAEEPGVELKVFYTWSQSQLGAKYDPDFGKVIEWDIPMLDGYPYEFVSNVAKDPGVHHFNGIVNPDLKSKILDWKPAYLLIVGWNFRSHLACMRYFKGKLPVLFKGDSTLLDEKPGIRKICRTILLRWIYSKIDYALYVGKNNHDYYSRHGLKESQLYWAPHAVDNERFHEDGIYERQAKQWKRDLGIAEDDLVLLFAGKLEAKKDPGFMLRLAQHLQDPRLKLIIVGNGALEKELKREGSRDSRIIFLDFQNQQKMPLVYRLGDIFVLPSRGPGETWGLAVNEAMACKRAVIVSAKCGCAIDLVEDKINGWVFEPGEKGELRIRNLLQKILDEGCSLNSIGVHAWQKIQSYSYPVAIARIKRLLEKIEMDNEN